MAFDKSTRNRLALFVGDARRMLAKEFTHKFQSIYGISDKGDLTTLDQLGHLDESGLATAALLRDRIEYLVKTHLDDKDGAKSAVDRLAREQAFTVLNRLAAIRMAEKRGLIVESVGKGYQSKGFKVFEQVAGSGLGDIYHRYRRYLFCLFDELAIDLGSLFDRRSPQALLFPREPALLGLLELINAADMDSFWAEDETIGWIYQYYNDPAERKKMREESAAPRNSRELAVRNQFFTPRYVVEFLTDNTLGRIWYEMTKGQTRLTKQCRYLVRRPTEIFLADGEAAPEAPDQEGLCQEELLKQPVYIPYRPLKDPREIRLLDPACGSMHFGLYAFDLFQTIYEEAWDMCYCTTLQDAYNSKDDFLKDVPRLIIENNIHGIDIDTRAVQIAGVSLWLRAQKAWQVQGTKPSDRPRVLRSNIVCAEPMPGSAEMLEEFVANLDAPLLGELVKSVFDKMQLAGEAGSLLKIEEEIRSAINAARTEWLKQQDDLFTRTDGSQEEFFETAEQQVIDALRAYAEQASTDSFQRRLFADDAARGFAFIDLCRKRYDAVVMNPPFGSFSKLWKASAKINYPDSYKDVLGAFVERFLHRIHINGRVGAITSRACFFLSSFTNWRKNVLFGKCSIKVIADLGQGVMDDAMVEAAAYVLENSPSSPTFPVFRCIADADRQAVLNSCINAHNTPRSDSRLFITQKKAVNHLPSAPLVYWIEQDILRKFEGLCRFDEAVGCVKQGLATADNPRFARTLWEVAYGKRHADSPISWVPYVLAGPSQPWFSPITLVVNWGNDAAELWNNLNPSGSVRSNIWMLKDSIRVHFFNPGFSWTRRAVRFIPYVIPSGCIPSASRYMAFPNEGLQSEALVVCASRLVSAFLRFYAEFWQRPNFLVDTLKALPWPELPDEAKAHFEQLISLEVEQRRLAYQNHEPFHEFLLPGKILDFSNGGQSLAFDSESLLDPETEKMVADAFGFNEEQARAVERDLLEAISYQKVGGASDEEDEKTKDEEADEADSDFVLEYSKPAQEEAHLSYVLGTTFGRWDIRYATGEHQSPELPDPFDPLPVCPPGMLQNAKGLPAEPRDVPADYPLHISWSGILVDDENHSEDIVARVSEAIKVIWKNRAETIEQEACEILGVKTLRDYFRRPAAFYADHLKRYSKSRRQAPIYWPLSTKSGSYTLWLYYHRLTDQTLHTCLADFLDPKIRKVETELGALTASGQGGSNTGNLREFLDELKDLRDEIEGIIKLPWKPNLDDGVLITASPLYKLFRFPRWQKDLKACWGKLAKGDYDWAHLAYTIWPKRVEEACKKDRSIAIAHSLEHLCKSELPNKAKRGKKTTIEEEE